MKTFYDLFAGVGGFRLGLERAGFQCVGSCEIDKDARKIYGKNFGQEPEASNALKLDAGTMPDFDILAAGFPCQAFSYVGKRLGFEDTRGTLFFEVARIARQKRPGYLFLENVEGLLSHDGGRTFATILLTLDELGYDAEWQVLHGSDFLPQRRKRVFIVGRLRDKSLKQVFPIGAPKKTPDGRVSTHTVDANYWKGIDNHPQRTAIAVVLGRSEEFGGTKVASDPGVMYSLTTRGDHRGVVQESGIRILTPLECERLQGFPDGWTEGVSERARYRCLGNAVMPPVIKYIATHFQI